MPAASDGGGHRAFGEGDFSVRVPVEGKDEVAELAAALNSMAVSSRP
ncbi:MAG: HAMP domain-containing protein [Acutalibacteraceae bacterium]